MIDRKFTAIDLYCGCGGLSLGLKYAGFDVISAVENNKKAQETYALNHPSVKLYKQDIRDISPKVMLSELGLKQGELDILAGCPPCQGFSKLRTKNKINSINDDRNNLINDYLRFVIATKPKTLMLENVPTLINDTRFVNLCKKLSTLGYRYIVDILDAADYGLAQRRKRLILLASRVHTPKIAEKIIPKLSVKDVIGNIEEISKSKDSLHSYPEKRSEKILQIIKHIPKNGGSRKSLPAEMQLECHKRTDGFKDVYGRMSWDSVAPTITSGCTNPSKGRFLHPSQNRAITLREASLLQGFPKNYWFDISHGKGAIALMIGNALPPPFIAAQAIGLRNALKKKSS